MKRTYNQFHLCKLCLWLGLWKGVLYMGLVHATNFWSKWYVTRLVFDLQLSNLLDGMKFKLFQIWFSYHHTYSMENFGLITCLQWSYFSLKLQIQVHVYGSIQLHFVLPHFPDDNAITFAELPCKLKNGGCQHICNDTMDGAICSCYNGYQLVNEKSCEGMATIYS